MEEYPDIEGSPVAFTLQERKLILCLPSLDADTEKQFRLGRIRGNSVAVRLNAYNIYELLERIASVASHAKNMGVRSRLHRLHRKVSRIFDAQFPT
jgi:hypothetical protein